MPLTNNPRVLYVSKKMKSKITEKIRTEFDKLREKGLLFKALAYCTPDYLEGSKEVFAEYAVIEKIPLAETFMIIDKANINNDFSYTELKFQVYLTYRNRHLELDNEALTNFATEIVRALSVEDMSDMLYKYKTMLLRIGEPAIKPLQDFIATEGKDQIREPSSLYPITENYDAARWTLRKLTLPPNTIL